MIKFRNTIDINDIEDFNDVVSEIIDNFLEKIAFDPKYCISLETDEDYENYGIDPDCGSQFLWRNNVVGIVDRATERFGKIAEHYFPEDAEEYFEVNLSNYVED